MALETKAASAKAIRFNTWEAIQAQLEKIRLCETEEGKIESLIELLVHLRLLGQDPCILDQRNAKGDIETLYAQIEAGTRAMLDAVRNPQDRFIYYAREVIKKLPVRQGAEEMIERIRADAEAFEESRTEEDPLRCFAGDLRKEVHRRLSPRIIMAFLEPYIALAVRGDPEPMVKAGYVALPARFDPAEEASYFIDLAQDLLKRLSYLWDYESGDLASVKKGLADNLDLFERCFLRAEVEGFLELLTPENLKKTHLIFDHLKRLASFKHFLKESYREGRIGLYDLILVDLAIGRLVFLLANDLTNDRFAAVTPRNIRDALAVILELLNISSIKGLSIRDVQRLQSDLEALIRSSTYDFIRTKRCLGAIGRELQSYLQADIIDAMSGTLNRALETYEAPTSKLSQIKTRFFNNFIRRTQIHVLSEFTEKVASAVDRELERQRQERQLHSCLSLAGDEACVEGLDTQNLVAATWKDVDPKAREYFGGKGNSILDMAQLGLNVPPAFILGYPLFSRFADPRLSKDFEALVFSQVEELGRRTGRILGDPERPLIVSVRSGAPTSMPGVMATILNVGLTPEVRKALEKRRDPALIEALYARFLENCRSALALRSEGDQDAEAFFSPEFLTDPKSQLLGCIRLVYESRGSLAVKAYSQTLATDVRAETAVTVQRLVFGNLNARSLSGVLITRNPITGEDELFGEFKRQAQGEEVVMGSANCLPIAAIDPEIAASLERCKAILIAKYRQDLDIEFTVEDGTLYLLQARAARLGAFAHLVADTDLLSRGVLDLEEYRERLDRLEMAHGSAALPRADFGARLWNPPITRGVPINSGVVSGTLVLSLERLKEAENRRESVVFFAHTTKPTDFAIMNGAHAIVTVYPGRTSHAAITAMAMNKPCIVGCADAHIDYERRLIIFGDSEGAIIHEGERVTADGNTGAVYRGVAPISETFLPIAMVSAAVHRATSPEEAVVKVRGLIESKKAIVDRETNLRRRTLKSSDPLAGKNILVRIDANIDLRANAQRDPDKARVILAAGARRVAQVAPTLRELLERGATPVVCSHLGDPGATMDAHLSREKIYAEYCFAPFAWELAKYVEGRLVYHDTSIGSSGLLLRKQDIVPGAVNLVENLRFATGEKDNDETFARYLADLSDGWYMNDAFNVCLRRHASIVGAPRFLEHRLAGPLVAKELEALELLLANPPRPFVAVFCGREVEAQFGVMAAMLPRVDRLAILLDAERDDQRPDSRHAAESMIANFMDAYPDKVRLASEGKRDSIAGLAEDLSGSGTILWSGPAGLDEKSLSCLETQASPAPKDPHVAALHEALCGAALTVVCSEEEKQYSELAGPGIHLSKGPRAFLEYLERLSLPGITALDPAR
ncbi:MAG: pyruvate orthophosphate dikinase [Spirochaetes bacterium]|nr:MAG: pyruvate orthophosphate dikinase [Spirochaetota bacterium]